MTRSSLQIASKKAEARLDLEIESVSVLIADESHLRYAASISAMIEEASRDPLIGLAKRSAEYVAEKIRAGKAVIAISPEGNPAGFCYIETWEHGRYVANSGLIVAPAFRGMGLAFQIKRRAFELSRSKFPDARLFGLTTSKAVMQINTELGYKPVALTDLTSDEEFWDGCRSCSFFDVLTRTGRTNCLCTAMLYNPKQVKP